VNNSTLIKTSTTVEARQLLLPIVAPPPIVNFEAVPKALRLGSDRHYLVIRQNDCTWRYPLQLQSAEVGRLVPRIREWNFALNAEGIPIDLQQLHAQMEAVIGGAAK
jgi:hypothetical protein